MDVSPVLNIFEKSGRITADVPMRMHTSFRVGGPADALFEPATEQEVQRALTVCREAGIPVTVVGNGSNLVVKDGGIRGLVIKIGKELSAVQFDDCRITAQAGARLMNLAAASVYEHGLMGLAFAGGIPASVGGAVAMNAGAHGSEMKNFVKRVRWIDTNTLSVVERAVSEADFGYRRSVFLDEGSIVLAAEFQLGEDDGQEKQRLEEYLFRRRQKQPLTFPCAGSVFKRPEGHYAGQLIEQAGLKGVSVGGAMVSELHAGFIVNTGNATAKDITDLIAMIQKKVFEQSGVHLQPEVRIIGEEQEWN